MPPTWFAHDPGDGPGSDMPHIVCPTCGCDDVSMVGHDFSTQHEKPDLAPHHQLTIEFTGACGHFWMFFFGDFADGCVLLDVVSAPEPKHPRMKRRDSRDRRWK